VKQIRQELRNNRGYRMNILSKVFKNNNINNVDNQNDSGVMSQPQTGVNNSHSEYVTNETASNVKSTAKVVPVDESSPKPVYIETTIRL
jgi:hypothetical protein